MGKGEKPKVSGADDAEGGEALMARKPVKVRVNPELGMQPYERLKMGGLNLAPGEVGTISAAELRKVNTGASPAWLVAAE